MLQYSILHNGLNERLAIISHRENMTIHKFQWLLFGKVNSIELYAEYHDVLKKLPTRSRASVY